MDGYHVEAYRVCATSAFRELHPEEEEHWLQIAVEGFEAHYPPDHPKRLAARERLVEVNA